VPKPARDPGDDATCGKPCDVPGIDCGLPIAFHQGRARDKVVFAVERVFGHFLASALPVREPLLISLVIPGFSY
jgi:hypothetical protein